MRQSSSTMEVTITELMLFFDELMPATNENLGSYWFCSRRKDGISVVLVCSIYKSHVGVIVSDKNEIVISSLSLNDCTEIRVLDENRKCLEILHGNENEGRCFLSLMNDSVLSYKNGIKGD